VYFDSSFRSSDAKLAALPIHSRLAFRRWDTVVFDKQVIVISHQNPRMNSLFGTLTHLWQRLQKKSPVIVVQKDRFSAISLAIAW
jgi:hypothetical protein